MRAKQGNTAPWRGVKMVEQGTKQLTDREILGWIRSRYVVAAAAFFAMFIISPYEYAFSSISTQIRLHYGWSSEQVALLFTLFVILESIGALPGGALRDRYGARVTTIVAGIIAGIGLFGVTLGPNYNLVLALWCIGSFFAGFIYNNAVTVANKWLPDRRGVFTGLIDAAFGWGSIPFVFLILTIPKNAPISTFINLLYLMAALTAGVSVVAGIFMKDPPKGWTPPGWVPKVKAVKRPSQHEYTFRETVSTWQFWVLVLSFILISSGYLAGVSQMVNYAKHFGFTLIATVAAVQSLNFTNGVGRFTLAWVSDRVGRENTMITAFLLTAVFIFLTIVAGEQHNAALFVASVAIAYFLSGSLFSLFPTILGHYYGGVTAGTNYGLLYAIAKGAGGVYGGVLVALLIARGGYPFAFAISGVLAVLSALILIPVKLRPPVWKEENVAAQQQATKS